MIVSGSTFRQQLGRVVRDMLCLHAVRHGMEILVYTNYPREAANSTPSFLR